MAKKDEKKVWKIGTAIIVVVFGLMAWAIVSFFWMGGTEEIEATANNLKPHKEWSLTQEQIEGPKSFCGDVSCPSVRKTWELPAPITKQEFEAIIKESGWVLRLENGCFTARDTSKDACWARGASNGYKILLIADNEHIISSKPSIQLTVEK